MKAGFVAMINNRVVEMIRSRYSVDDELGILRTAPSEEAPQYNAWVEECRAWGRGEKMRLGV
jgi:hypothetical protein